MHTRSGVLACSIRAAAGKGRAIFPPHQSAPPPPSDPPPESPESLELELESLEPKSLELESVQLEVESEDDSTGRVLTST
jgi:hypothetical protein